MSFTDLFIRRPVLASVVSLLILVIGIRALLALEVRQYPETRDTVVTVTTSYPGADSALVKGFVTTPLQQAIARVNRVIAGKPDGMRLGIHLCRGNKQSYWQAEGGYDLVADTLFNEINADCYFLEYDSPRAGDFSPLKFLPKDKTAILGLVSTKTSALETKDDLKKRVEEAAKIADIDNLALSPQCGFASDHLGNQITVDDQIAKLALVVETAKDIWGD